MGNAVHLPSCRSCGSTDIMCMTRVNDALRSGCTAVGGVVSGGARVVHTVTGEVVQASEGTTAAEIMMEHPNHFLICSTTATLVPGKRFVPLASHQLLVGNHLYFLLPMAKLRYRLTAQDLALLTNLARNLKNLRATTPAPFALPPPALSCYANRAASAASHTHTLVAASAAEDILLSSCVTRSASPPASLWRPSLQTIDETPHLRSWTFREALVM